LQSHNIQFLHDIAYFADCRDVKPLRFDFIILDQNIPIRLIEFDGEQHYRNVEIWSDNLEDRKRKDKIKNEYAKNNLIPLIRIPFTDFKTFTFEDLFSDKYLLETEGTSHE